MSFYAGRLLTGAGRTVIILVPGDRRFGLKLACSRSKNVVARFLLTRRACLPAAQWPVAFRLLAALIAFLKGLHLCDLIHGFNNFEIASHCLGVLVGESRAVLKDVDWNLLTNERY